jgi:hypothetical protein
MNDKPVQLPLWGGNESNLGAHYASVSKSSVNLQAENTLIENDADKLRLDLPRRWEFCVQRAERTQSVKALLATVRTPPKALDELAHHIQLVKSSGGEGALWIFHGDAGTGKSTFLHTLENTVNTPENEVIEVQVIRGEDVNLRDRLATYAVFKRLVENRRDVNIVLTIVLEDVEVGLTDDEMEGLVQALKLTLRSTKADFSQNIIVAIPVNNHNFASRLRDISSEIGLLMRESATSSLYVFEGPRPEEYIEIVEELTRVLNGRPLEDYGIKRDVLEKLPKRRESIGKFIQEVVSIAHRRDTHILNILRTRKIKKIVTIFAFCRPMNPVDLYNAVQLMVSDSHGNVSTRWLLEQGGKHANRWNEQPENFAAIVSGALRVKVVEFPPHVLNQMVYLCGDADLQDSLREYLRDSNITGNRPRNWINVRRSIARTNLVRLTIGDQTTRPSHVTDMEINDEDTAQTARRRELLRKGVATGKWAPSQNQHALHGTIALALKEIVRQNELNIVGLQGIYAEAPIRGNALQPDITIETADTLFFLEFNYETPERITRNDIANYIVKKINSYCDGLDFLRQMISPI